jgi:hypothetical protein
MLRMILFDLEPSFDSERWVSVVIEHAGNKGNTGQGCSSFQVGLIKSAQCNETSSC